MSYLLCSLLLKTQCRLNLRPGALRDRAAGGVATLPGTKERDFPLFLHFGDRRSPAVKQWFHSSSSVYCTDEGPQQPILFLDCSEGAQSFPGSLDSWVNNDLQIFLLKSPKPASFI